MKPRLWGHAIEQSSPATADVAVVGPLWARASAGIIVDVLNRRRTDNDLPPRSIGRIGVRWNLRPAVAEFSHGIQGLVRRWFRGPVPARGPLRDRRARLRSGRGRLGGSCCAVLLSRLRISVTCGPFGPGPARTSSVAPGGTLSWPPRSTTLTCRKASPDPSANWTKPKPLSGLYHLTTARTGGPEGASNLWAPNCGDDPKLRRGGSKLSSSKPRRRAGRKSLSLVLT